MEVELRQDHDMAFEFDEIESFSDESQKSCITVPDIRQAAGAQHEQARISPQESDAIIPYHFNASRFTNVGFEPRDPQNEDYVSYYSKQTDFTDVCENMQVHAQFGIYSFKAGNYNVVFTEEDLQNSTAQIYAFIIDCGFGDGTNSCADQPFDDYLKLLYKQGYPKTDPEIVVKAVILTHGHFDHGNSLRTLLFEVLNISRIECVILGGNTGTYFDTSSKKNYNQLVLGEICAKHQACQFYHSGLKRHLGALFNDFNDKLNESRATLDVDLNLSLLSQSLGAIIVNYYMMLALSPGCSALSGLLQENFIPCCIYKEASKDYQRRSPENGWVVVPNIEYLGFLSAGNVKLVFPVLNFCFSDDPPGPQVISEKENDLCLMVLVLIVHSNQSALRERLNQGENVDGEDRAPAEGDVICKVLFMADASADAFRSMEIGVIDVLIVTHHSHSGERYVCLRETAGKKPKIILFPLAERFFTARRGYIQAHLDMVPTLAPVRSHNLFYHILNSNNKHYEAENKTLKESDAYGYKQKKICGLKKGETFTPVLYRKKEGCTKAVFTIFDYLLLNVVSRDGETRYIIHQPSTCHEPKDQALRVATRNNRVLNTE